MTTIRRQHHSSKTKSSQDHHPFLHSFLPPPSTHSLPSLTPQPHNVYKYHLFTRSLTHQVKPFPPLLSYHQPKPKNHVPQSTIHNSPRLASPPLPNETTKSPRKSSPFPFPFPFPFPSHFISSHTIHIMPIPIFHYLSQNLDL